MSRIPLTGGFTMMSEGEQILKITEATYKEDFGKVKLTMVNASGQKHFENFTLTDKEGNTNDGACGAFSALAKTALCDQEAEDVDVSELVGCYIKGEIAYREYDKDGVTKKATTKAEGTYWEEVTDEEIAEFEAKAGKKQTASKPSAAPKAKPTPAPATPAKGGLDLKSLLGR